MTEPIWHEWRAFPDPTKGDFLTAPFGAGVYWLRDSISGENIYIGEGSHVAQRMTSLLPAPLGHGTRNNAPLRDYVLANIQHVVYRTAACPSKTLAELLEAKLIAENKPRF
jgi:excinuclease UvrABC nuclease subunit